MARCHGVDDCIRPRHGHDAGSARYRGSVVGSHVRDVIRDGSCARCNRAIVTLYQHGNLPIYVSFLQYKAITEYLYYRTRRDGTRHGTRVSNAAGRRFNATGANYAWNYGMNAQSWDLLSPVRMHLTTEDVGQCGASSHGAAASLRQRVDVRQRQERERDVQQWSSTEIGREGRMRNPAALEPQPGAD